MRSLIEIPESGLSCLVLNYQVQAAKGDGANHVDRANRITVLARKSSVKLFLYPNAGYMGRR